ncbi:MAG: 2-oxo acid dehydrogenase subunit E2 [Propionibacteriaceae bacterium]|nr:2-oxo acid dehydrogenase subunit E2 [Propionibacteriaceae bacterium]
MATEMVMPKLGLSMTKATITEWFKHEGDRVAKNDDTLEIETEKLTYPVPAPTDGVILKVVAETGTTVPVGEIIAYIGEPGEQIPASLSARPLQADPQSAAPAVKPPDGAETPTESGRIKIAPAAKVLAQKLNVDWSVVTGTGPGGRITKEDIEAFHQNPVSSPGVVAPSVAHQAQLGAFDTINFTEMRKAIATKMTESWSTAPMVTNHVKADVEDLIELRHRLNADLSDDQLKLTLTDLLVKILAKAIKRMPIVNATVSGDVIMLPESINIGVAMALDQGLIVPVVHDADKKDVFAISKEIRALSEKANKGSLAEEDITGGTFTVTNLGSYGSVDFFTPIINQPESAILGVGAARKEPAIVDGAITGRWLMGLSLTYDHRVIDGAPAAKFMAVILDLLRNPARALFEP